MDSRASICWRARPRRRRTFILLRPLSGLPSQKWRRRLKSATRGSPRTGAGRRWWMRCAIPSAGGYSVCLWLTRSRATAARTHMVGRRGIDRTVTRARSWRWPPGAGSGRSWACLVVGLGVAARETGELGVPGTGGLVAAR